MSDTAMIERDAERAASEATDASKKLPFPLAKGKGGGYDRTQVEAFLARARATFEGTGATDAEPLTADDVREIGFAVVRRGFDIAAVDQALGRIEEAFAARERRRALDAAGPEAWVESARAEAQEILDHLRRPKRHRFARTTVFGHGYSPAEVDTVADRISEFLSSGAPLEADQVRHAAFRMVRRGYREEQVDALLDAVIRIVLAVR